ncbi:MAG: DUF6325 family protein [Solirubrobacteraceae bacterium]
MTEEEVDELGPVDYLVVEFPADKANFSGEMADQLSGLVKSGAIRVLDLLFLKKNPDGSVEGFESHEFEDGEVGQLRELEAELALLLAEEDVEAIGAALEPDSYAAVLVWENVSPLRRTVGRQRPDPDPSVGSRSRGGRSSDRRSLRCWVEVELADLGYPADGRSRAPRQWSGPLRS